MSTGRRVAVRRRLGARPSSFTVQSLEPRLLFAGGPDPTFGVNGIARLDYVGPSDNSVADVVFAPNGKLLVIGDTFSGSVNSGVVLQYLPDGRLDTTFGIGGVARAGGYGSGRLARIVPQADGSMLLLAGGTPSGARVVKMDASGQIVSNWSVSSPGLTGTDNDLIDLGAGRSLLVTSRNVAFVNADGTLDHTITLTAPMLQAFNAYDAAVDSAGRVVVIGELVNLQNGARSGEVRRYLPGGQLDTTFDGDGIESLPVSTSTSAVGFVGLQPDGKVVAVISDRGVSGTVFRLNVADGSVDAGFGAGGNKTFGFSLGRPHMLASGKLSFAGYRSTGTPSTSGPLALQLTPAGQPDTSFDADGIRDGLTQSTWLPFSGWFGDVRSDGRMVIGATIYPGTGNSGATEDVVLFGLNANGSSDTTFGTTSGVPGQVITDVPESLEQTVGRSALDSQGRILIPGSTTLGTISDMLVGRLTAAGAPDTSFGPGGFAKIDAGGRQEFAWAAAVQANGSVVAVGRASYFDWQQGWYDDNFLVARFLANGQPDTSFGSGGKTTFDFGGSFCQLTRVALQGDGKILASGIYQTAGSSGRPAVVRLLSNGALDTTFGSGGLELVDAPGSGDSIGDLFVLADGGILVGGSTDMPTGTAGQTDGARYVLRLKASNGTPDPAYGSGGYMILQEPEPSEGVIGFLSDGTGSIYLAGGAGDTSGSTSRFLLTKLTSSGAVDTSFGTAGTSSVARPSGYAFPDVARVGGGFVAAGSFRDSRGNSDMALLRMRADGTADPDFGAGGFMTYDLGSTLDQAIDVHAVSGGVVVTGTSSTPTTGRDSVAFRVNLTPPKVTAGSFQADASGTKVRVTFNSNVSSSLSTLDLRLANQATPTTQMTPSALAYDAATNTATFTFTAPGGGPLADGDYAATLLTNGVWDASGNHVDGDGNGSAGGDWGLQFSQLTGLTAAAGSAYTLTGPANNKVLSVTAGTVTLTRNLSAGYPGVSLNVSGNATVYFAVDQNFANVSLSGNGSISVGQPPPSGTGAVAGTPPPGVGDPSNPTPTPAPATQPLVLSASNTGFVRDGGYANTAFTADPSLVVKRGPAGFTRETYLTFDLSQVGTVHSAKLRLFGRLNQAAAKGVQVRVYAANRAQPTGRLTWNSRPPTGVSAQASAIVTGTGGRWYEWDISSLLRVQKAAGRNVVTLALKGSLATDAAALFDARPAGATGPRLVIA